MYFPIKKVTAGVLVVGFTAAGILFGVPGCRSNSDSAIDYNFEMVKNKAGWQINYIATSNFD